MKERRKTNEEDERIYMTLLAGRLINHSVRKASVDLTRVICTFIFITSKGICCSLWKYIQCKKNFVLTKKHEIKEEHRQKNKASSKISTQCVLLIPPWVLETVCRLALTFLVTKIKKKVQSSIRFIIATRFLRKWVSASKSWRLKRMSSPGPLKEDTE